MKNICCNHHIQLLPELIGFIALPGADALGYSHLSPSDYYAKHHLSTLVNN
jgi:hypothetical protein